MKTVNISTLKDQLSAIIAKLESYGSITVLDRNQPVAVIYPAKAIEEGDATGRLIRLERAGVVQRSVKDLREDLFKDPPPKVRGKADIVEILLDERRQGR